MASPRDGIQPYHNIDDYYKGYAKTLAVAMKILCFVIPAIVAVIVGVMAATPLSDAVGGGALWIGVLVAFVSYGIMAFVTWLVLSYFLRVFDILADMAHNVEYLAWIVGADDDSDE